MRKPIDRREPGAGLTPAVRHRPTAGNTRFYVPPTLESDFQNWLDTDMPHVNYTFDREPVCVQHALCL